MLTILYNPINPSEIAFAKAHPDIPALIYLDATIARYPNVSGLPAVVDSEGEIFSNVTSLDDLPLAPDAAAFYNALASCEEYGAVFAYAVANPTTPIPFLVGIVIDVTTDAKSYQQSGGKGTSFDRVDAALASLITALPATVGDFTKADIVAKIQAIAKECRVSLPSVV